mmetsp:Transcript_18284/g.50755  ORF Transcript_18284/g.50755 Transcript_18284/m.50755 type:complete len:211 (-) Transcript_18284:47-679(-)
MRRPATLMACLAMDLKLSRSLSRALICSSSLRVYSALTFSLSLKRPLWYSMTRMILLMCSSLSNSSLSNAFSRSSMSLLRPMISNDDSSTSFSYCAIFVEDSSICVSSLAISSFSIAMVFWAVAVSSSPLDGPASVSAGRSATDACSTTDLPAAAELTGALLTLILGMVKASPSDTESTAINAIMAKLESDFIIILTGKVVARFCSVLLF